MHNNLGIPVHVAVTGHRDIPAIDIPALEKAVNERLTLLQSQHPCTPIRVLSGLAEGADRIVARAAIRCGMELIAVLPIPVEHYIQDFYDEASRQEFSDLLAQCVSQHICTSGDSCTRDEAYAKQGQFIVRHSQLVFALWDGIYEQVDQDGKQEVLKGGTADVIRMCKDGVRANDDIVLSSPEPTPVLHFLTRRIRHADYAVPPVTVDLVGSYTDESSVNYGVLTAISKFNQHARDVSAQDQQKSAGYLLGNDFPPAIKTERPNILAVYACADSMAGLRQIQRRTAIRSITAIALFSIFFQQVYSGPDMRFGWLLFHIIFAGLALLSYHRFFCGTDPREEQFIEWRVLAEGLRVQFFWESCGLFHVAADHYRTNRLNEVDWIAQSIRNLSMTNSVCTDDARIAWVKEAWIADQANYFKDKKCKNAFNSARIDFAVRWMFIAAILATALTLIAHFFDASTDCLNYAVLLSGMLFVSSAIIKTYGEQMGFDDNARRYERAAHLFDLADKKIGTALQVNDIKQAQNVIYSIGQEALAENSAWLQMNRSNQFEVSIA